MGTSKLEIEQITSAAILAQIRDWRARDSALANYQAEIYRASRGRVGEPFFSEEEREALKEAAATATLESVMRRNKSQRYDLRDRDVAAKRIIVQYRIAALQAALHNADVVESVKWASDNQKAWLDLCAEWVSAILRLEALEEKAAAIRSAAPPYVAHLPMAEYVGAGLSIQPQAGNVELVLRSALTERVMTQSQIREARKNA